MAETKIPKRIASIVINASADYAGTDGATMYVWSQDDTILFPVGDTLDFNGHRVLPVKISTGKTSVSFSVKAVGIGIENMVIQ